MKNVDFKSLLETQYVSVMREFPEAVFYEMQVHTSNGDRDVMDLTDVREIKFVFQLFTQRKALIYTLTDGVEQRVMIDGYWLEDRPIHPYQPADFYMAYERLKCADYVCRSAYAVLRHPLAPKFIEPCYIFGDIKSEDIYFVGSVSADVEVNKGINLVSPHVGQK